MITAIFMSVLLGFGVSSLTEYLMHRVYLHWSGNHPHITAHHKLFHGLKDYSDKNAKKEDILSNLGYVLVSWLPTLLISMIIWFLSGLSYYILAIAVSLLYLVWVEYAHYRFHKPAMTNIEKTRLFKILKEHHRIHHVYYQKNYGIGSNMWDKLLNTNKYKMQD